MAEDVYGSGARVYKHRDSYRITLSGLPKKRYPKDASFLKVPYRTVLGGAVLDLTLVVRFPKGQRKGVPLEVFFDAHDLRRGRSSVLGELALLRWRASRPGAKLATDAVGQPLGVWIYGDGEAVAACLEDEVPRRSLKRWLALSRQGPDPSLRKRVSLSAREPHVDRSDRPRGQHPQGVIIRVLQPKSIVYPFGGEGDECENDGGDQPARTESPARQKRPYLAECEAMDFGGLRAFIDESLDALAARTPRPLERPGARPSSEKEFRALLGMLRGKIGDFPAGLAVPDPGPAPDRRFWPSEELLLSKAERDRLRDALRVAERGGGREADREARILMRALHLAERHVFSLEAREREAHADAVRSHEQARAAHVADRRRRGTENRERAKRVRTRTRFAENLEKRITNAFGPGGIAFAGRLTWALLPPGKRTRGEVLAYYETLRRERPDERYEPERIRRAFSLGPESWYVGSDEFDGYIVFTFARTDRVLLECPKVGNAIYVLGADWKRLSKMSKGELLAGSHVVSRVLHRGDWFRKVGRTLGLR